MFVELKQGAPQPQSPVTPGPFHVAVFPDGTPSTLFFRTPAGYLLRFPDHADFHISLKDAPTVWCLPAPGARKAIVEHLYLNQVLPMLLGKLGSLVFHASAVEIAGEAVAFVGQSRSGKSTLAAGFALKGMPFLTDDALVLEPQGPIYLGIPSHPSVRLCKDSERALMGSGKDVSVSSSLALKTKIVAGGKVAYRDRPCVLRTVYFLGDDADRDINIHRLGAAETLIGWLKHSFILDVEDEALLRDRFTQTATLANRLTCHRLNFPRRFDQLDRVLTAIIEHVDA